jgi:hypothetical protein
VYKTITQKEQAKNMARYEHLSVYRSAYKLNIYFYQVSQGFPKEYKYGLADEIRKGLTYVLVQIMQANQVRDKRAVLAKAETAMDVITIKVRMLHDLKIIKLKRYECISRQVVDVTSQLQAWKNWDKNMDSQFSQKTRLTLIWKINLELYSFFFV